MLADKLRMTKLLAENHLQVELLSDYSLLLLEFLKLLSQLFYLLLLLLLDIRGLVSDLDKFVSDFIDLFSDCAKLLADSGFVGQSCLTRIIASRYLCISKCGHAS